MPQYIKDLYDRLSTEYSVEYYTETDGEYSTVDCFIIDGYCVKLDRIDVDTLSALSFEILVEAVKEMLAQLKSKYEEITT